MLRPGILQDTANARAQPSGFDPDVVRRSLDSMVEELLQRLPYLVVGLVVALIFYLIGRLTRRALHAAGRRTRLDVQLADLLDSLAVAVLTILAVFVAAVVIFPTFKPGDLVAGLGITSVAIGFAFKDILQNFFAGILILWRKPFRLGDQIRAREFEGTVEEITTRSTRVKTYDGERVVIPNGDVYISAIPVRTAYDSVLAAARRGLNDPVQRRHLELVAAERTGGAGARSADDRLVDEPRWNPAATPGS